jgi:hypothetical protein
MKLRHLVLIRYSISLYKRNPEQVAMLWLLHRLRLFRRTVVPTLSHQTCHDFTPVLFCDPQTPADYTQRLKALIEPLGGLIADHSWAFYNRQGLLDALDITPANTDVLMTTRLDNDDVIHEDFIARAQAMALEHLKTREDAFMVDFRRGYWLFCGDKPRLFELVIGYPTQFLSVVEPLRAGQPCYGTKGCYCANHPKMLDEFPWMSNGDFAAWVWMVYGGMQTTFWQSKKEITPMDAKRRGGIEHPTDVIHDTIRKRFHFEWPPLPAEEVTCKT